MSLAPAHRLGPHEIQATVGRGGMGEVCRALAEVVPLRRGDGVVFAVSNRPVQGTRGVFRVNLRRGVSRLRPGHRHTVGVIFHDAK